MRPFLIKTKCLEYLKFGFLKFKIGTPLVDNFFSNIKILIMANVVVFWLLLNNSEWCSTIEDHRHSSTVKGKAPEKSTGNRTRTRTRVALLQALHSNDAGYIHSPVDAVATVETHFLYFIYENTEANRCVSIQLNCYLCYSNQ